MAYENILVDIQGPVGIVVLNRPQSLNAIDKATIVELLGAFETLRDTDAVRAIVFTGAGRAFSSGGDIKEMVRSQGATSDEIFREHIGDINRTISLMGEIPKPVIAAINGSCAGVGFNFALAADVRIATKSASFTQAFINIGLIPDGGGTFFLPRVVGWSTAFELFLSGRVFDAAEAHQMGIVSQVVEDAEFETTVKKLAGRLAAAPTATIGHLKRLMRLSYTNDLSSQLQAELETQLLCGQSHDFREGITAFVEKRRPNFQGK